MRFALIHKKKHYIVNYIDMPITAVRTIFTAGTLKDTDAHETEEELAKALGLYFKGTGSNDAVTKNGGEK